MAVTFSGDFGVGSIVTGGGEQFWGARGALWRIVRIGMTKAPVPPDGWFLDSIAEEEIERWHFAP